jgi:uncharacterized delta-60 repeat protein
MIGSRSSGAGGERSATWRRWGVVAPVCLLLCLLALAPAAHGAGELDPSFSGDGKVVTGFAGNDQAHDIAIQADGKIVAAGWRRVGDGFAFDFALARYNPNGSLDPSFGGDGRVVTDFGGDDRSFAVAIQANGKIVAAGQATADFALARYKSDGSLDPSFGGDGKVTTDFGGFDRANAVAIQADGKIVAAGWCCAGQNFALARYNADGSLDRTFDGDGKVVTDFGRDDRPLDIAIQADQKIVAAGTTGRNVPDTDFALARYNANGSLDSTFDGDGRVVTDFGLSTGDGAAGVAIQPDGKVVAAGATASGNFALARYNPNGSLDPSFSGDGKLRTDFGNLDGAADVAIQPDGRIVAAGGSGTGSEFDFALARYRPRGGLDATFGGDGRVLTDFGAEDYAIAGVAIQADGRIVAAGFTSIGSSPYNFALARYLP